MTSSDQQKHPLQAVVFDWAGTTIDFGSRAPALVFREVFRRSGVPIEMDEARGPMGKAKREHIAAILALPRVAAEWQQQFGRPPGDDDVGRLYEEFLPLQKSTLAEHSDVIPGVADAVAACRQMGLKIGSSTGYTRDLMDVVVPRAAKGGYQPDAILCADDVPAGRPAPWMLFRAAEQLNVYPMRTIVKVDDTPVGIEAGRNAGTWTVGITRTGNALGLSQVELNELPADELHRRLAEAGKKFVARGAHFVLEAVAELPGLLPTIEQRLLDGQTP
jgi:phosphonoacetaldehyde hydrolase